MLGIEISALSMSELKQLLEVARARGQQALADQITAELRARPGRAAQFGPGQFGSGQPWSQPGSMAASLAAPPADEPRATRRRRRWAVALTAGAGGVVTAALVWGVSMPPQPSALTPVNAIGPAPRAAVALTTNLPVASDDRLSDPVPAAVTTLTPEPSAAPEAPAAAHAAAPASHNPCYEKPTPAERLLCGYPSLAEREKRLKAAYQAAIAAGADPQVLAREQAAWTAARNPVSDRVALADLYEQRIRDLSEAVP